MTKKVYVINTIGTGADKVFESKQDAQDYLDSMPELQRTYWHIKEKPYYRRNGGSTSSSGGRTPGLPE